MASTPTAAPSSTPEPTPTPKPDLATSIMDIVGVWEQPVFSGSWFMEIGENGTMSLAKGVIENLDEQPYTISNSWFEGNRFMVEIIETVAPSLSACVGEVGIYEVQLLADGSPRFVAIEDECEENARETLGRDWIPVQ